MTSLVSVSEVGGDRGREAQSMLETANNSGDGGRL